MRGQVEIHEIRAGRGSEAIHFFMHFRMVSGTSFRFIFALALTVFSMLARMTAFGQDTTDLSDDPHFRDELGVNDFTTPSIEKLFATLDALKPIPSQSLVQLPKAFRISNRVKLALNFGILISDGFLAVESEDSKNIETLGRELLRRAKGLGVEQRVTRHSKQLLDLAKQSNWPAVRKELIVTQKEVEKAMLDLRDEEMAHLLSLGGWIRGLEIAAACVVENYSPERLSKLRQLDLLDYYLDRLNSLPTALKSTLLLSTIVSGLQTIREKLSPDRPLSETDAVAVQETARALGTMIEEE
jgi:hypothetical protein